MKAITGELLAIDPSITSTGVALFRGGQLVATTRAIQRSNKGDIAARCLRMAQEILAWLAAIKSAPRTVAMEWPQIYRATKSKGNPNLLIPLAGVCGTVTGAIAMGLARQDQTLEVLSYLPKEWSGGTPKATAAAKAKSSARAKRIEKRLSEAELIVWRGKINHDEIDAIGIGLYALGRFEPLRVLPGAS